MGAWAASLYSDDTTCDVRDSFVTHLKHGKTGDQAIQAILAGYGKSLDNHEVECLVLFSLADTAWKYGRLTSQVRDRAIALISRGGDVHVWERDAPKEAPLRRKALDNLKARLLCTQPDPKPVRLSPLKPKRIISDDVVGSVFLLDLPSQRRAAMVLVDHLDLGESIEPVFSVLGWCGHAAPTKEELMRFRDKALVFSSGLGSKKHVGILCFDKRKNPLKPLQRINITFQGLPYDSTSRVFVTLDRIAAEADAQLGDTPPNNSFKPKPLRGSA